MEVPAWLDPENEGADELLRPSPNDWRDDSVTTGLANKCDREHQGLARIGKGPPGSELPSENSEKKPRATIKEATK